MCMLTLVPEGIVPDPEGIENGAFINNDGHGWAIVDKNPNYGDRIIVGHGMNKDNVIEQFIATRKNHPQGEALFHSRWATHGTTDTKNCHPFFVGRDNQTVLAHNGILGAEACPKKGDPRSDTRKFAESIVPKKYANFDDDAETKKFCSFIGRSNKILVLTVNPRYMSNFYLYNEDLGEWYEDVWYSNLDFLGYGSYRSMRNWSTSDDTWSGTSYDWPKVIGASGGVTLRKPSTPREDGWLQDACPFCFRTDAINHISRMCEGCGVCLDCEGAVGKDCLCYMGSGEHNTVTPEFSGGKSLVPYQSAWDWD